MSIVSSPGDQTSIEPNVIDESDNWLISPRMFLPGPERNWKIRGRWITYMDNPILHLPEDRRMKDCDIFGNTIVIGSPFGIVTVLKFRDLESIDFELPGILPTHLTPATPSTRFEMTTVNNGDRPFRFLDLPPEIRLIIYRDHFTSKKLKFRRLPKWPTYYKLEKPALDNLALLYTCKLVNHEARNLWLGQVTFVFRVVEDMLKTFSPLPMETLSRIRYANVKGYSFTPIALSARIFPQTYHIPFVLNLLPGLRLDTLTVIAVQYPEYLYDTITEFVKYGSGWRKLIYHAKDSQLLAFRRDPRLSSSSDDVARSRRPQPSTWQQQLIERDGTASNPSVTIYRSTKSRLAGSVLNPDTREIFEQKLQPGQQPEDFEIHGDALRGDKDLQKEVLVVIQRGKNADITDLDELAIAPEPVVDEGTLRSGNPGVYEQRRWNFSFLYESSGCKGLRAHRYRVAEYYYRLSGWYRPPEH
ncbi:uncharacterized protein DSM5745_11362 [Aspergillus mulundensis]|uniref:F-box domain-containing protein n=1 Tax=Aspergillus mulundensis TaxID=1810919 RepID=A0A3D8Q8T2_9EURO|nr:hypothetical protein DSM5745_11362 [Aspergillus mulundensis]RDW57844.1 hypothetical protein DSM5745_11362 [Aspergillus mulundensis]